MTRARLARTLAWLYIFLGVVLSVSLLAKFADHIPLIKGTGFEGALKDVYEFLRDMSLLIATGGAAYIANVYQKRSGFVASLEQEWRGIVSTKNALYAYCETADTSPQAYIAAFCRISESLDNMRIVYRNVGETDRLIGLYPYAPLHDMRRALQTLDPRKHPDVSLEHRKLVRDAILQSFYALRERFLEELDLEEPTHPLLISGGRRLKISGATSGGKHLENAQRGRQERSESGRRPDIDALLAALYEREQTGG
jgi:hypothetical protein